MIVVSIKIIQWVKEIESTRVAVDIRCSTGQIIFERRLGGVKGVSHADVGRKCSMQRS